MADFSLPALNSLYPDVLTQIKARDDSIAKMFDGTTDTNVVVGSIKYNSANKQLEKWNGTGWVAQQIGNLATDSVGAAQVQNFSLPANKIRGTVGTFIPWRNVGGTADFRLIGTDTSGSTVIDTEVGRSLWLFVGGALRWLISAQGNYFPVLTDLYSLGAADNRIKTAYIRDLANCDTIYTNGGNQTIGPISNHGLILRTSNANRWYVSNDGHLKAIVNGSYDIGSWTEQCRNVYTLTVRSATNLNLMSDASTSYVGLGIFSDIKWLLDGDASFRPSVDGLYSLGDQAHNATRVWTNSLYSSIGDLFVVTLGPRLQFGWNNTIGIYMENAATTGTPPCLRPITDATTILGYSAARWKEAWIKEIYDCSYITAPSANNAILRSPANAVILQTGSTNRLVAHADGNMEISGIVDTAALSAYQADWVVFVNGTARRIRLYAL